MSRAILLADDHTLMRAGLKGLVSQFLPELSVLEAANGTEAIALVEQHQPELALLDINMPVLNGLEALPRLLALNPAGRVIMLSMFATEAHVQRALKLGASGYLLKDSAVSELVRAIELVRAGGVFLSAALPASVRAQLEAGVAGPLELLTPRQREVLQLLAEGHGTKEIAFRMGLSAKTVETHRQQLMERLQIFDVPGLVRFAVRSGLIDPAR